MPGFLKVGPSRQQVAIAGRVTDAETGRALGGVQVAITEAPGAFTSWLALRAKQYETRWESMVTRPDRTRTAPDGHFHLTDLPPGQYGLTASLPGSGSRYGTADIHVTVSRAGLPGDPGKITPAPADLALSPTTLKGQVTGTDVRKPLLLAEVRIQGSGERAFTDARGHYLLAGLEVGARTVLVSAQGYTARRATVQLRPAGAVLELDVALDSSAPSMRPAR